MASKNLAPLFAMPIVQPTEPKSDIQGLKLNDILIIICRFDRDPLSSLPHYHAMAL